MIDELNARDRLFAVDTTVPVLAPRTGKTRKDCLWAVVRDQRGWFATSVGGAAAIRGKAPNLRRAIRQKLPKPIIDALASVAGGTTGHAAVKLRPHAAYQIRSQTLGRK